MLMRVTEELYWLGRRLERVQNTARMLLVCDSMLLDASPEYRDTTWATLLELTGSRSAFDAQRERSDQQTVVAFVSDDSGHDSSISSILDAAKANLRSARAYVSPAVYTLAQQLCSQFHPAGAGNRVGGLQRNRLESTVRQCATVAGSIECSMRYDSNYQFLHIGYLHERADLTTRILKNHADRLLNAAVPHPLFVLQLAGAERMCLAPVHTSHIGTEVFAALLCDAKLPRSVLFCLNGIDSRLRTVTEQVPSAIGLDRARQQIRSAGSRTLTSAAGETQILLNDIQEHLLEFGHGLAAQYFPASAA